MSKPFKNSIWSYIGKLWRKHATIPEGMGLCSNCGRMFPLEELSELLEYFGSKQVEMQICEECECLPPSTWRAKYPVKRVE